MRRDLESREEVPTLPCHNDAPDFAHHDGNKLSHFPVAKRHHAPAILVVHGEEPALPYPARVGNHISHSPSYQLAWDGKAQVNFGRRT